MRTIFRTTFTGARGVVLACGLLLALGGAAYAVTSTPATDFSIVPAANTATTSPGGAVGYGINLQASGGFSDNVTLSATGQPAGSTVTFGTNPSFVDASLASASTMWVNTTPTTPIGPATITVTGTSSGGVTHSITVMLNVVAPGSPDYAIEMTPTTQYVSAGNSVTYNVKVVSVNQFSGTVLVSVKSVPGAVLLGWNSNAPTTAQGPTVPVVVSPSSPGTATLTVATTSTNPPGSYAITVTGTSGSTSHATAGTLDIDLFSATGSTAGPLYPGAAGQPITVALTDPYNYGVTITGLSASVAQDSQGNVINSGGSVVPGCLAAWFKFGDTPLSSNNTIFLPSGATQALPANDDPTITMLDPKISQNACKGAQLKLNFVGSAQH